ncbi:uncharacterized protein LOC129952839 [Eupeodes corollae]|uniref:uncharacterized protein LOC129952839 n=1 Tax=Eupeodes corollae TaxID=290404 RepID=UPI0024929D89|nr:uncharacterized protein LOC129952839 [Eupeodes corollae]
MSSRPKAGSSCDNHPKVIKKKSSSTRTRTNYPSMDEHIAHCRATDAVLQKTITSDEHFSALPPDCTLEELQSEIALARGQATTIYVKRDGLCALKVVLPQKDPTIANLKRAIERTANLLQQRRKTTSTSDLERVADTKKSSSDTPPRRISDGALIAAPAPRSGRPHQRSNPSWRFLWRAYCLGEAITYNKEQDPSKSKSNSQTLPDTDGRQLLSDFGIGHKSVLRFVKRENYFGRQRQRS